jgi:hypothetical protein
MSDKKQKTVKWKCRWGWHENRTRGEKPPESENLQQMCQNGIPERKKNTAEILVFSPKSGTVATGPR